MWDLVIPSENLFSECEAIQTVLLPRARSRVKQRLKWYLRMCRVAVSVRWQAGWRKKKYGKSLS